MSPAAGKQKKAFGEQNPKQKVKKSRKSRTFPWKLLFGVVAIISVVTLLSNSLDQNSIRGESSKNNQNGLNGFSLGK